MKEYFLQTWRHLKNPVKKAANGKVLCDFCCMQQVTAFIPRNKKIGNKLTVLFNSTKQSFAIICLCGDVSFCLQDVKSKPAA